MIEFQPWPKIPRLFRDCVITEKIDGTNAAVGITEIPRDDMLAAARQAGIITVLVPTERTDVAYAVHAQSRKRIITPAEDNHGFANWVFLHSSRLVHELGPGLHFGEWWGSGINRGYGLEKGEKRFSLFNTKRWEGTQFQTPGLGTVPVLYEGTFGTAPVLMELMTLARKGSQAAPGFMNPEGVVVFHKAASTMFKVTIEGDEAPKGAGVTQ